MGWVYPDRGGHSCVGCKCVPSTQINEDEAAFGLFLRPWRHSGSDDFDLLDIGENLWSQLAALHHRVETVHVGHDLDAGLTNIGGFEVRSQSTHGRIVGIFTCVHRAERREVRQAQYRFACVRINST